MTRSTVWLALACFAWAQEAGAAEARPARTEPKGLLASVGIGPGFFSAKSGTSADTRHYDGATLSLAFLFGGHVTQNFALGGAYLRDQVYGLRVKDSAASATSPNIDGLSFYLSTFAFFGDVTLPLTLPELHLQAFLGYANLGVSGRSGNAADIDTPSGLSLSGAVSTEFRVASRATLGLTARMTWAPLTVSEISETNVRVLVPALLLTARYD